MKTGKKLLTGSLLALCAVLLVLCIVLAIGWSKAAKTDTALPEKTARMEPTVKTALMAKA